MIDDSKGNYWVFYLLFYKREFGFVFLFGNLIQTFYFLAVELLFVLELRLL